MSRTDPLHLPPGYQELAVLTQRPGVRVVRALWEGREVAVRIEAGLSEVRAELEVLAALEGDGLARLVDHGALPGGGGYVTTEWISGVPLADLRGQRTDRELGRIVARLALAVGRLHRAGFVHGDLKAENVLVVEGDQPVLLDFGLAGRVGDQGPVRGSYFHLAPERLLGHAIDSRCDVFALGVTLAALLAPFAADARSFHGRFPAEPFAVAAGLDLPALPEWSRDLIASATDRDPARRPHDADWIAETLAGRLGGLRRRRVAPPRLAWPPLSAGREDFVRARARHLRAGHQQLEVWTFPDSEEAGRVGRASALHLSLAGDAVRGVDFAAAQDCRDGLALDQFVRDRAAGQGLAIGWGFEGGLGARLLRALIGANARRERARWILCVPADADLPPECVVRAFPPLDEASVVAQLRSWLPGSNDDALAALGERVHAESQGCAARAEELIAAVAQEGWIRHTRDGLQLRSGQLPDHLGRVRRRGEATCDALPPAARQCLAALVVHAEPCPRAALAAVVDLTSADLAAAITPLIEAGCLVAEGAALVLRHPIPHREELRLSIDDWEALHRRWADQRGDRAALVHRWLAGDGPAGAALRERIVALRDSGLPEGALAELDRIREHWFRSREAPPCWVDGEALLAWSRLGNLAQLDRLARRLEQDPDPRARSYALRGRAREAALRHDHRLADEKYREAAEVDPDAYAEATIARARIAFEARDDATLRALLAELPDGERAAAVNLRALVAMSELRLGHVDEARAGLEESLAECRRLGETAHEPSILLNMAILQRRTAKPLQAIEVAELSLKGYEQLGDLAGIARVQLLLGGAWREAGYPLRSEQVLVECASLRERLGDTLGAARARGVLGLALAERGHALAALQALEDGQRVLAAAGVSAEADLLAGHAQLAAVRLGREVEHGIPTGAIGARIALLRGELDDARASLHREVEAEGRDAAEARRLLAQLESADSAGEALLELLASGGGVAPLMALARQEEVRGRDDRAARAAIAAQARAERDEERNAAAGLARACVARATAGCTDEEARAWLEHLLGVPDPAPDEVAHWNPDLDEDEDVDLYRLLEINQRLVDQRDLPQLLGEIVEAALEVTGAERGFLALEEDGELHLDLALDSIRGDLDPEEIEVSQTVLRETLEGGATLRVSNAAADPVLASAPSVAALELRSILCCPFRVEERVRGVIYLDHRVREGAFDARAARLLELLAGQAALAIRQRRRVEEIEALNGALGREVATRESDLRAAQRVLAQSGLTVPIDGLVGESEPMVRVHELLRRIAGSDLSVLVAGESGTGKELAARALHMLSRRNDGPFITENCAALPATIVESELFGHTKGAFTGAEHDRPGLFERADGGTLFLDEVGELPLDLQAKLLRVLETRELRRLGSEEVLRVDFRLVAATNRDLAVEVEAGRFRGDLMYRLDAVRVELPSLAERLDDLPLLIEHFLRLQRAKDGVRRRCSPAVLGALSAREWPGNVRELANEIARLCVLEAGDLQDPQLIRPSRIARTRTGGPGPIRPLAELEKEAILGAVARCNGSKGRAAQLLGVSRAKVFQRWKEWHGESE